MQRWLPPLQQAHLANEDGTVNALCAASRLPLSPKSLSWNCVISREVIFCLVIINISLHTQTRDRWEAAFDMSKLSGDPSLAEGDWDPLQSLHPVDLVDFGSDLLGGRKKYLVNTVFSSLIIIKKGSSYYSIWPVIVGQSITYFLLLSLHFSSSSVSCHWSAQRSSGQPLCCSPFLQLSFLTRLLFLYHTTSPWSIAHLIRMDGTIIASKCQCIP